MTGKCHLKEKFLHFYAQISTWPLVGSRVVFDLCCTDAHVLVTSVGVHFFHVAISIQDFIIFLVIERSNNFPLNMSNFH